MTTDDLSTPAHERYSIGYSDYARDMMAQRTVTIDAEFLVPYLRPGLRLLDVGCGPGSITIGLA